MNGNNVLFTSENEALLTAETLVSYARYEGDHEKLLLLRAMARKLLALSHNQSNALRVNDWLDCPVSVLKVSARCIRVLTQQGFGTIRQVFETGSENLLRYPRFGHACVRELEEAFTAYDLIFPPYPSKAPECKFKLVDAVVENTVPSVPIPLLYDLVRSARANKARFERDHGRFTNRPPKKTEYDRLCALEADANELLREHNLTLPEDLKNGE